MYYPFKFYTEIDIEQIYERIKKSDIFFSEDHEKTILAASKKETVEIISDLTNEDDFPLDFNLESMDEEDFSNNNEFKYKIDEGDLTFSIGGYEDFINLNYENNELNNFYNIQERLNNEFNRSKDIYGFNFTHSHKKYLLLPCKVKLHNNETVWLNCLVYIFANNMGILKLELPLVNTDITPLQKNNLSLYIKEIKNNWIDKFSTLTDLDDVASTYINIISKNLKVDTIKYNDNINHIIFSDFEGLPNNINSIPNKIQENIYSIVSAPLPQIKNISYKSEAREHLQDYSWKTKTTQTILKTTGGALSIIDKNYINEITKIYKKEYNVLELEDRDYNNINEITAKNISFDTEFALLIVIFKKMISADYYISKINSLKDMFALNNEYYRNIIFINEMQEECYGSVTEQVSNFEDKMPFYLKKEITNNKSIALDKLLVQYKQKKEAELQDFVTIFGLIISILFGLPAINETLILIRKVLYFIPNFFSHIRLYHLSFIIWFLCNLTIIYKFFDNKRYYT